MKIRESVNIIRLAWNPYAYGAPEQVPIGHALRRLWYGNI